MKITKKDIFLFLCAGLVLLLLSVLWGNRSAIEVSLPEISSAELSARVEKQQQQARVSATRAKERRVYTCEVDEDCIIVDKDPCGCLVGPQGVTAINALLTLEFNQLQKKPLTTTCPDQTPSTERECSPTAQAVCVNKTCQISY